jgi:hypothetical protein
MKTMKKARNAKNTHKKSKKSHQLAPCLNACCERFLVVLSVLLVRLPIFVMLPVVPDLRIGRCIFLFSILSSLLFCHA